MLRFSIRDLLWLVMVVALGLAWFIRERQVRDKEAAADLAIKDAKMWKGGAGALELELETEFGCTVTWDLNNWKVIVDRANIRSTFDVRVCEPNPDLSQITTEDK